MHGGKAQSRVIAGSSAEVFTGNSCAVKYAAKGEEATTPVYMQGAVHPGQRTGQLQKMTVVEIERLLKDLAGQSDWLFI